MTNISRAQAGLDAVNLVDHNKPFVIWSWLLLLLAAMLASLTYCIAPKNKKDKFRRVFCSFPGLFASSSEKEVTYEEHDDEYDLPKPSKNARKSNQISISTARRSRRVIATSNVEKRRNQERKSKGTPKQSSNSTPLTSSTPAGNVNPMQPSTPSGSPKRHTPTRYKNASSPKSTAPKVKKDVIKTPASPSNGQVVISVVDFSRSLDEESLASWLITGHPDGETSSEAAPSRRHKN